MLLASIRNLPPVDKLPLSLAVLPLVALWPCLPASGLGLLRVLLPRSLRSPGNLPAAGRPPTRQATRERRGGVNVRYSNTGHSSTMVAVRIVRVPELAG